MKNFLVAIIGIVLLSSLVNAITLTTFSDDSFSKTITFASAGSDTTAAIKIPKGAIIGFASMRVSGYINYAVEDDTEDSYSCSGDFHSSWPCSYAVDENWVSFASVVYQTSATVYENYNIPSGVDGAKYTWKVHTNGGNIKLYCWNYAISNWGSVLEEVTSGGYNTKSGDFPNNCISSSPIKYKTELIGTPFVSSYGESKINWGYYPTNPSINIGNDGDTEWSYSGEFSSTDTINFVAELQSLISTCTADANGDCTIPIKVSSESAGKIVLDNLNIAYTKANGDDCSINADCTSGYCRTDWDDSGKFCADDSTSCVYDDDSSPSTPALDRNNEYVLCGGADNYKTCNSGVWSSLINCPELYDGYDASATYGTHTYCGYYSTATQSCTSGLGDGCLGGSTTDCGSYAYDSGGSCFSGDSGCDKGCGAPNDLSDCSAEQLDETTCICYIPPPKSMELNKIIPSADNIIIKVGDKTNVLVSVRNLYTQKDTITLTLSTNDKLFKNLVWFDGHKYDKYRRSLPVILDSEEQIGIAINILGGQSSSNNQLIINAESEETGYIGSITLSVDINPQPEGVFAVTPGLNWISFILVILISSLILYRRNINH